MTENEIVKALEHCKNRNNPSRCRECEYVTGCKSLLLREALDLINRQKAEIEELNEEIDRQYEQAKADILGNMADGGTSCHWCIEQHKAEAIKEFAERIHNHCTSVELNEYIDSVVEEMVGEG